MATVLWLGDGGCHSGFARVTHSIGDRLVTRHGHDVHVLAYNHRGDYWPTPMKLYRPDSWVGGDIYGKARHIDMLSKVEPDVVVMLNDANILLQLLFDNPYDPKQYLARYRPIITYVPVDGHNLPPNWPSVLTKHTNVVAMSRFGQEQYPGSRLVYHGVDTDVFHPVSEASPVRTSTGELITTKRQAKKAFGYDPDGFLILRVDKNSGRKDFPATWKALLPVMRRHRDIQVHWHTDGKGASGVNVDSLLERSPDLHERFFLPDLHTSYVGWAENDLVALYNAADLFVSTSRGEGFGLTIAESLACGVPVVAQNVSAIPEVVGPGGVLVDPQREITVPPGHDLWLADIDGFSSAIEQLYLNRRKRKELGERGREHVATFSWDVAADRFHEYIEALASGTGTEEASVSGR